MPTRSRLRFSFGANVLSLVLIFGGCSETKSTPEDLLAGTEAVEAELDSDTVVVSKLDPEALADCLSWFLEADCTAMEPEVWSAYSELHYHCNAYTSLAGYTDAYSDEDLAEAGIPRGTERDLAKSMACSQLEDEFDRCKWNGTNSAKGDRLRGAQDEVNPGGSCGVGDRYRFVRGIGFRVPTNEEIASGGYVPADEVGTLDKVDESSDERSTDADPALPESLEKERQELLREMQDQDPPRPPSSP